MTKAAVISVDFDRAPAITSARQVRRELVKLQAAVIGLEGSTKKMNRAFIVSAGNAKKFKTAMGGVTRGFTGAGKGAKDVNPRLKTFSNRLTQMGKSAQLALGPLSGIAARLTAFTSLIGIANLGVAAFIVSMIAVGAVMVKAAKSASALEFNLIRVNKVADFTERELKQFSKTIQNLSVALAVSKDELFDISEAAARLGIRGVKDITLFAEIIGKVTTATDLMGEQAATAFARILKVTGEPVANVEALANVIVRLGNNVAASESEIVEFTNAIARATGIFGVSSVQAAAFGAVFAEFGGKVESSATALGKILAEINVVTGEGGRRLNNLKIITGLTADELNRLIETDPSQFLVKFVTGLKSLRAQGGVDAVISALRDFGIAGVREAKAIFPLIDNVKELLRVLGLTADETGKLTAVEKEAAAFRDSLRKRTDALGEAFSNLFASIGEDLIPILKDFVTGLTDVIKETDTVKRVLGDLIDIGVGLLVYGQVVKIFGGLAAVFKAVAVSGGTLAGVLAGIRAFGLSLLLTFEKLAKLVKPLAIVLGALGAFKTFSQEGRNEIRAFAESVGGLEEEINAAFGEGRILDGFRALGSELVEILKNPIDAVGATLLLLTDALGVTSGEADAAAVQLEKATEALADLREIAERDIPLTIAQLDELIPRLREAGLGFGFTPAGPAVGLPGGVQPAGTALPEGVTVLKEEDVKITDLLSESAEKAQIRITNLIKEINLLSTAVGRREILFKQRELKNLVDAEKIVKDLGDNELPGMVKFIEDAGLATFDLADGFEKIPEQLDEAKKLLIEFFKVLFEGKDDAQQIANVMQKISDIQRELVLFEGGAFSLFDQQALKNTISAEKALSKISDEALPDLITKLSEAGVVSLDLSQILGLSAEQLREIGTEGVAALITFQQQAEKAAKRIQGVFDRAFSGLIDSFQDLFTEIFKGNLTKNTINDFFSSLKDTFAKFAAELLTQQIERSFLAPLFESIAGGFGLNEANTQNAISNVLGGPGGGAQTKAIGNNIKALKENTAALKGQDVETQEATSQTNKEVNKLSKAVANFGGQVLTGLFIADLVGGGNSLGAKIGAVAGNVIGTAIGGPIVGKILAAIGGFIGGLFAKDPFAKVAISGGAGGFTVGDTQTGGRGTAEFAAAAKEASQSVADLLNNIATALDSTINNIDAAIKIGEEGRAASFVNGIKKSFPDVESAVADLVRRVITSGGFASIPAAVLKVVRESTTTDLQQLVKDIEFALEFSRAFGVLEDAATELEAAISDLNKQFDEAVRTANRLGLSEERVNQARQLAILNLRKDFEEDIRIQILDIVDPLAAELARLDIIQEERLRNAIAVGANILAVEQLNALERQQVIEGFANSTTSSLSRTFNALQAFLTEITATSSSNLPLETVLANAQRRFTELRSAFLGGDTSVANELIDASRALLDVTRSFEASGPGFFSTQALVEDTIRQALAISGGAGEGQQQIAALTSIDEGIQTTNELIERLTLLLTGDGSSAGGGDTTLPPPVPPGGRDAVDGPGTGTGQGVGDRGGVNAETP